MLGAQRRASKGEAAAPRPASFEAHLRRAPQDEVNNKSCRNQFVRIEAND
jgi:hypothetical protein